MKLFITDHGDPSVGIFPVTWEVDFPLLDITIADIELADWFKEEQIKIYKEFADGKLTAEYEYELKLSINE